MVSETEAMDVYTQGEKLGLSGGWHQIKSATYDNIAAVLPWTRPPYEYADGRFIYLCVVSTAAKNDK